MDTADREDGSIRRRRRCDRRGHRWTTFEVTEEKARALDREAILANVRSLGALIIGG